MSIYFLIIVLCLHDFYFPNVSVYIIFKKHFDLPIALCWSIPLQHPWFFLFICCSLYVLVVLSMYSCVSDYMRFTSYLLYPQNQQCKCGWTGMLSYPHAQSWPKPFPHICMSMTCLWWDWFQILMTLDMYNGIRLSFMMDGQAVA